jgi:(p)ppGpp synthase/HD superfamily hydrolase
MQAETPEARLMRAAAFAAEVHTRQRRKGAAQEPYVNHVLEVAAALAAAGAPLPVVLAGLLHDTIEDGASAGRPVTEAELAERFGADVAAIVAEVSDDKTLPKAERKRRQADGAVARSAAAKMVMLADKTANLRAIAESPPPHWDTARKREYLAWAEAVAAGCRGVNPALETGFEAAVALARAAIDEQAID